MEKQKAGHSFVTVRTYALIWVGLLLLTWLTVTVARMHIGTWSVLSALVIATVKASLVLLFFMHLKYEKRIFTFMFLATVATLAVFIGFTFFDIAFR